MDKTEKTLDEKTDQAEAVTNLSEQSIKIQQLELDNKERMINLIQEQGEEIKKLREQIEKIKEILE